MQLCEQYLELVSVLTESRKNFKYIFLYKKAALKFKNHFQMFKKYWMNYRAP